LTLGTPGPVPRPRATLRDVANLAGVGVKTVSRVVNGVPTVAPDLVARVQRAAQQLNYRPNLAASNLRRLGGGTATIGLLLEDIGNPFSAAVHRAVEDVARRRNVAVLAASLDEDPVRERELAMTLVDRRVDGLIVVPAGSDQSYLLEEMRTGTQIVFVDRPPSLLAADTVVSEHRSGAEAAVAHLLNGGHRRIGYLGDFVSIRTAQDRYGGYVDALRVAGVTPSAELVRHDLHTAEAAEAAATEMLTTQGAPTALFTSQNLVTVGAIRALRALDLHHVVALVGFDDVPLADLLVPGVTTVAQDPRGLGTAAAELLFGRLDGDSGPTRTITLPTTLVARGSGEIPPATPRDIVIPAS
jgi:LacI family transcriptional regulator